MLFILLRFQNLQIEKYLISQKFNGTNYPIIPTAQSDFLNENIWVEFRCFAFHFDSTIRNLDSFYRIHWPSFSCFYDPPYRDRMHITLVRLHSHIVLGFCWPLSFQSKYCQFLPPCYLNKCMLWVNVWRWLKRLGN